MNAKLRVVLLSNYGAAISLGLFAPIYALFVVRLGGSGLEAGLSSAVYYFLGGSFMLLLRPLQDLRANRPKIYMLGYVLEGVTAICLIFTATINQLYLVQVLHAFATALRVPSQRALYAEHEDKGLEGSEWSIMEGGDFMILGAAAAAGGIIVSTMSFDLIFSLMAIIQFAAATYCLSLLRGSSRN